MHSVLFRMGPLTVYTYGTMLALGFASATLVAMARARGKGISPDVILDMAFWVFLSSIIGSRFQYVLTHWGEYSGDPLSVFRLWRGGFSMYGGVIAGVTVGLVYLHKRGAPTWEVADCVAPGMALAVFFTRIGCFLNGCCFGRPTEVHWCVSFPPSSMAYSTVGNECVHPTQLYESAAGLLMIPLLVLYARRNPPAGSVLWLLLTLYCTVRLVNESFRFHDPNSILTLIAGYELTVTRLVSMLLMILGVTMLVLFSRRRTECKEEAPC